MAVEGLVMTGRFGGVVTVTVNVVVAVFPAASTAVTATMLTPRGN